MLNKLVITFGLTEEENNLVLENLPSKECKMMATDCYTDLIAIPCFALVVNPDEMISDEAETILDYYVDIEGCFSETVIFTHHIDIPVSIRKKVVVATDFSELKAKFKYLLLSGYRRTKKSESFSTSLSYGILILSEIRKHPGITTGELAEKCDKSARTVQRYIEALRAAGEWIEYDTKVKGWKLQYGKSVLWGDI
jgi:biotin operon repressor